MLFEVPNAGSNGCGSATYTQISAPKERTAAEVQTLTRKLAAYNDGLYERSNFVRSSAEGGFKLRVALRYLHSFFNLDLTYPGKRLIQIELKLAPSAKTLIRDPSVSHKYSLHIADASLDL